MTALRDANIPGSALLFYDLTMAPPQWISLADPIILIFITHGQTLVIHDARIPVEAFNGLQQLLVNLPNTGLALVTAASDARPPKRVCMIDIRPQAVATVDQTTAASTMSTSSKLRDPKTDPKSVVDLSLSAIRNGFDKLIDLLKDGGTFKDTFPQVFPQIGYKSTEYRYFSTYRIAYEAGILKRFKFHDSKSVQQTWADLKLGE